MPGPSGSPRNRPRIAGQRRTAKPETPDELSEIETAESEAVETDAVAEERVQDAVTPATTKASKVVPKPSSTPVSATDSKRGSGNLLMAALAVVVILTLTVAAVLGVKAWHGKQAEDARDQASAAGRKAAETALSYDYRDLDKSFAAARATMTPDFAAKFDATAKVAGELATKTKATVKADVREVAVRDGDADRVTLIIFVNQTTTSTITKGSPRVDLNRTRFTMVRNGGRWLVQEIAGL
jgi:Mce-associated membrane protein